MDEAALFKAIRQIAGRGLTQAEVDLVQAALRGQAAPTTAKRISPKGVALIKEFEGLRLKAYPDPATGGAPWTIGVGHTGGVKPGDVITEAKADEFLRADLERFEGAVNKLFPVTTQNQFDALVSLCFNVGEGNLSSSTLRTLHNHGQYEAAQAQFKRWNRAAGKEMAGLTRRRSAEALLYGSPA